MDRGPEVRAWNVFRRLREEALCCALPVETQIPPFLLTGEWSFAFCFTDGDPPIEGFSPAAASIGISYNGFYLFSVFGSATPRSH
jgi:hypothetical protein